MKTDCRRVAVWITVAVATVAGRAEAFASYAVRDARVTIAGYRFGLVDMNPGWNSVRDNGRPSFTLLDVGPAGTFRVPFDIPTLTSAARHAAVKLLRP